jgi:hypothetical protein
MTREEKEDRIHRGISRLKRLCDFSEVIVNWNEPLRVLEHAVRIGAFKAELESLIWSPTDEMAKGGIDSGGITIGK